MDGQIGGRPAGPRPDVFCALRVLIGDQCNGVALAWVFVRCGELWLLRPRDYALVGGGVLPLAEVALCMNDEKAVVGSIRGEYCESGVRVGVSPGVCP